MKSSTIETSLFYLICQFSLNSLIYYMYVMLFTCSSYLYIYIYVSMFLILRYYQEVEEYVFYFKWRGSTIAFLWARKGVQLAITAFL